MSFVGKVALITGASSGIGAATAVRLAKQGASLALAGRNVASLTELAKKLDDKKHLVVVGDVTKESDTVEIVNKTIERYGKLNVLVNSAGIIATGTIETTTLEQYDHVMNTNVRSIYHLAMLTVPYLIQTQGSIVNVSSVNGIRSFPGVLAYNLSKAAVDQLTRCVALELAAKNVRVNSVNPGFYFYAYEKFITLSYFSVSFWTLGVTITNLHKRGGMDAEAYAKFLEHSKTTHAMGRAGQADEVAAAIEFLASDAASFITGASLPVDGGRHAMCPR